MSTAWLAAAFFLSLAVPLAEALFPPLVLARGSATALGAIPWLALATCPRSSPPTAGSSSASRMGGETLSLVALALLPLALGAGLDLARGAAGSSVAWMVAATAATLLVWVLAAEIGARAGAARTAYAVLWLLLLPGLAAFAVALRWVPPESSPPGGAWLAIDPLVWCHRSARVEATRLAPDAAFLPLGVALLVLLGVGFLAHRAEQDAGTPRP